MPQSILVTLVLGLCGCTSAVRTTKLELVDATGATVAELGRNNGTTSLRLYEYPGGERYTTLEMKSHAIEVRPDFSDSLKQLGYGGDEMPRAIAEVTLASKNGLRAELSCDGVTYYGKDGSVLWVVVVSKRADADPTMEFFDGQGKVLFSTASFK